MNASSEQPTGAAMQSKELQLLNHGNMTACEVGMLVSLDPRSLVELMFLPATWMVQLHQHKFLVDQFLHNHRKLELRFYAVLLVRTPHTEHCLSASYLR